MRRFGQPLEDANCSTEAEQSESPFAWLRAAAMIGAVSAALLGPVAIPQGLPGSTEAAWARRGSTTASGERVNKDQVSLLQLALPLEELKGEDNVQAMRQLQSAIESVKANTITRLWSTAKSSVDESKNILGGGEKALLKPVEAEKLAEAKELIAKLKAQVDELGQAVDKGIEAPQATDYDTKAEAETIKVVEACQATMGKLEETVIPNGYASPVASDVPADLPRLNGRAVVEMTLKRGEGGASQIFTKDDNIFKEVTLTIVCDGWAAPISAGNFVDLVDKGYYNGMAIQRADGFIIQTGDNKQGGYKVEGAKKARKIPLEVGISGQKQALYGETIDEARMVGARVKIPFQADGVISMAREEFDNDSATSQFFMIIFESDMTPAGKNFLDGRYGSFGYTIEGSDFLRQVAEGDVMTSVKVVSGLDKLQR